MVPSISGPQMKRSVRTGRFREPSPIRCASVRADSSLMERLNSSQHELALRLFMAIVLAHWGEHLLQGFQIYALGWPVQLGMDIFHTASQAWDARFMSHSTVVRTCSISAGDVGTTEFDIDEAQREALVEGGEADARTFLEGFERGDYMNTFGATLD